MTIEQLFNRLKEKKEKRQAIRYLYDTENDFEYKVDEILREEAKIFDTEELEESLRDYFEPLEICKAVEYGNFKSHCNYHKIENDIITSYDLNEYEQLMLDQLDKTSVDDLMDIVEDYDKEIYNYINTLE